MSYRGHIKNGVVVFDGEVSLAEGTEVQVDPVQSLESKEGNIPTLYERLKPFFGTAKTLPPDASLNVDHYLYGQPKK